MLEALLVERARAAVRAARRFPRSSRAEPGRPPRPAHLHDRPGHGEGLRRRALVPPRGGRDPRVGAHRRRLATSSAPARPLDDGAAERAFSTYVPGTVAPMLPPRARRRCLLACARTRTGCASRSRSRRAASRSFYRSVIRSDARLTYGEAERREAPPDDPRGARAERRARDETCANGGSRAARCRSRRPRSCSASTDQGGVAEAWLEGEPHAHMLVEELMILANEHVAAFLAVAAARGALPRPRAARPAGGRAAAREAHRPRRADAARARRGSRRSRRPCSPGEISKRVARVRRAVGPRARGVPVARPARAQAGALRPARTSATPGSRAPRTATSPRRSAATRTSSCTVRLLRELGLVGRPRARRPAAPRRARVGARARGGEGSSTSPTTSASPGCSSGALFELRLGRALGRARSPG